jgi:polysaccharide pyruvyl transferase WcaK-like protein
MKNRTKKIVIVSSIPINNGDAALIFSLGNALNNSGYSVIYSTHHFNQVKSIYPNEPFVREITDHKILKKLPFLKPYLVKLMFSSKKAYHEADVVISAPGGYLNSYYGFEHILTLLKKAKQSGKITGIYAQSVGPLNTNNAKLLVDHAKYIDYIFARDQYSMEQLKAISYPKDKYSQVEDGAFLIEPNFIETCDQKVIAFSVRRWKHDHRDQQKYTDMILSLVKYTIDKGFAVEFISTCQGLKGYVDDSEIASEIMSLLPERYHEKCTIDKTFYTYSELMDKLHNYYFVVGTRLHMCILSLIMGVPAFNISYEVKGSECYGYLGVPELSIDYNETADIAISRLDNMIENEGAYRKKLRETVVSHHDMALKHFNQFITKLGINI